MGKLTIENVEHSNAVPVRGRKGTNAPHYLKSMPAVLGTVTVDKLCGGVLGDSSDDALEMGTNLDGMLCKRCERIYGALLDAQRDALREAFPEPVTGTLDAVLGEAESPKDAPEDAPEDASGDTPRVVGAQGEGGDDTPVRCEKDSPAEDLGGGRGECRACGWKGPLKAVKEACDAEDHSKCAHTCDCRCKHKRPCTDLTQCRHMRKCPHKVNVTMAMTAHWRGGRTPKQITMREDLSDSSLAVRPATVDKGNHKADDLIKGNAAGMLPGRTSLTRGRDMTGAQPRERAENGKPVPTTMDAPLGRVRTDVTTRKQVVATDTGVAVVDWIEGGQYGYLPRETYNELSETQKRRYRRHVQKNRARAQRAAELVAQKAERWRELAERDAAKRIAATAPSARRARR